MKLHSILIVTALIALVGTAGAAAADPSEQESRILSDRWYFSLGTSVGSFSTEASVGFGSVLGTFVRIEDDLALDENKSSFRFNGIYAFNHKHQIDFTFTDFSRDGVTQIDKEITIGDDGEEITYEVGADLATEFDSTSFKAFYKYSFVNTGKSQAGLGAGLSLFDYSLTLAGTATVNGGGTEFRRLDESIVAPVPSFLMFIHHAIKPKLVLRTTAGYFDLDTGDLEGSLLETRFTLDYFVTNHFAIGGGLEGSDVEYKDLGDDPVTVSVDNKGFIFYVAGAF